MEIQIKTMLKYYLIFKILLFQSFFINAQDSTAENRNFQLVIDIAKKLPELKFVFLTNKILAEDIDSENIINRTLLTNNNELNENLWKLSGYSNVPTIEDNIEELANSEFLHRIIN